MTPLPKDAPPAGWQGGNTIWYPAEPNTWPNGAQGFIDSWPALGEPVPDGYDPGLFDETRQESPPATLPPPSETRPPANNPPVPPANGSHGGGNGAHGGPGGGSNNGSHAGPGAPGGNGGGGNDDAKQNGQDNGRESDEPERMREEFFAAISETSKIAKRGDIRNAVIICCQKLQAIRERCAPKGERLEQRRTKPVPRTTPLRSRFELIGATVSTPGNLTTIIAQPKAGKSAVVGAMIASILAEHGDFLGFRSDGNQHNLPVLHFDTEQSCEDAGRCLNQVLERAGLNELPGWVHSYHLDGMQPADALRFVLDAVSYHAASTKKLHSVFIDGVGDLIGDVNDLKAATSLVALLRGLATEYDCPFIVVLHLNPSGDKTAGRGHLGSQLERKAESNLRLDMDASGACRIWSTKQRRKPIPKQYAIPFRWDDDKGMYVSCIGDDESYIKPQTFGRPRKATPEDLLEILQNLGAATSGDWQKEAEKTLEISRTVFMELKKNLQDNRQIERLPDGTFRATSTLQPSRATSTNPSRQAT